jgi:hypothetical protein
MARVSREEHVELESFWRSDHNDLPRSKSSIANCMECR